MSIWTFVFAKQQREPIINTAKALCLAAKRYSEEALRKLGIGFLNDVLS